MRADRVIKLPVFRTMFFPVARKEWKCNICKTTVTLGERYIHYIDRRPHEIISYRFHRDCFAAVEAYCKAKHRTSFTPRTVQNWLRKSFCEKCLEKGCELKMCKKISASIKIGG